MISLVTPVEAENLKWFFSSHADAAFGIKSPLGGQLERQKLRLGRPQTSPEFREVGAGDRVFVASMKKRLEGAERACPGAARVLEAYDSPQDLPVLPLYWRLGRVMLLTKACGGAEEWQVRAADTAGRKGDREAAEWLRAIRREAVQLVAGAERAFAAVCKAIGLRKRLTPRGMRRTYQDLMRASQVEGIVVRAISGHASAQMQERYSTVSPTEMRAAVGRLAAAAGFGEALELAGGVEAFPLRGANVPEEERRALYTPKKYRPAPGADPESGGGHGTGGGHPTGAGPSGGHRPE